MVPSFGLIVDFLFLFVTATGPEDIFSWYHICFTAANFEDTDFL
jgi:hypothetical protein